MRTTLLTLEHLESRLAPAIFAVTTTNDAGAGSLRQALADADVDTKPDKIVFKLPPPTNSVSKIKLTSGELTSKGNVTIVGPGAGKLIIDGDNDSRILNVSDFADNTDSPISISGLSLLHGKVADGGGALRSKESLTLKNVVVSGNTASSGGGVFVSGTLAGTKVTVSNSLVTSNYATNFGGGLDFFNVSSVTISKTVVIGNTAAAIQGGGIHAVVDAVGTGITIQNSTIAGNTASQGGGIYLQSNNPDAKVKATISNSVVSSNESTNSDVLGGGGIFAGPGNIVISNSTVQSNKSVRNGGGIHVQGSNSLTIRNTTISGNHTTAANSSLSGGGGIAVEGDSADPLLPALIQGSKITDNFSARIGGGLFVKNGVALGISLTVISGNSAVAAGAGLFSTGTGASEVNLTISGGSISSNHSGFSGGGIFAEGSGDLSISSTKINSNVALGSGGGVFVYASSSVDVRNVEWFNNHAGLDGGAVYFYELPSFQVKAGSFKGNSATNGGGIYALNSEGSILGAKITQNYAHSAGGGVYGAGGGSVTLQIGKVSDNIAPTDPNTSGAITPV